MLSDWTGLKFCRLVELSLGRWLKTHTFYKTKQFYSIRSNIDILYFQHDFHPEKRRCIR